MATCYLHGTTFSLRCPDCEKAELLKRQAVAIEEQNNLYKKNVYAESDNFVGIPSIGNIILTFVGSFILSLPVTLFTYIVYIGIGFNIFTLLLFVLIFLCWYPFLTSLISYFS
jgi:hypothetical protein